MAPPRPIENQNTSDLQGDYTELSCPLPAPQEEEGVCVVSVRSGTEYVQDSNLQISYSRPAVLIRQPTSIFQVSLGGNRPSEGDRRAAQALGRALEALILDIGGSGEPMPAGLHDLADLLNSGRFPSADEVNSLPLFNQSYKNIRLDCLLHTIAVRVTGSRSIHGEALALTLPYYLRESTSSPLDQSIRQGIVVALSTSSDSQTQALLASAQRTAPRAVRSEIAQLIRSAEAGVVAGVAGAAAGASTRSVSPGASANLREGLRTAVQVGTTVLRFTHPTTASIIGLVETLSGNPALPILGRVVPGGEWIFSTPGGFTHDSFIYPILDPGPRPHSWSSRHRGEDASSGNMSGGGTAVSYTAGDPGSSAAPSGGSAASPSGSAQSSGTSFVDTVFNAFRGAFSFAVSPENRLLASVGAGFTSPAVAAQAAMMTSLQLAMAQGTAAQGIGAPVSGATRYAVAAVTPGSSTHSDSEGSGHSDSSDSGRHSSGEQDSHSGNSSDDQNRRDRQEPDTYIH